MISSCTRYWPRTHIWASLHWIVCYLYLTYIVYRCEITSFTIFGHLIVYCQYLYLFRPFLLIKRQYKPSPYRFWSRVSKKSSNLLQRKHRYFIWTINLNLFSCFIHSFPIPLICSLLSEGPMDSTDFLYIMGASWEWFYIGNC